MNNCSRWRPVAACAGLVGAVGCQFKPSALSQGGALGGGSPSPNPSIGVSAGVLSTLKPPEIFRSRVVSASASAKIKGTEGGQVVSPDHSVVLAIPPGALGSDTEVSIDSQLMASDPRTGGNWIVHLGPSGMVLNQPAELLLKLPDGFVQPGDQIGAYSDSEVNPQVKEGGEITSSWLEGIRFDSGDNVVGIPVTHFSYEGVYVEKPIYLVFDIPGSYLKKGDLLYTLIDGVRAGYTDSKGRKVPGYDNPHGASWIPGHAGMYLGSEDPLSDRNNGFTVIESTPKDVLGKSPEELKDHPELLTALRPVSGPQFVTLTDFQDYGGSHVYMGARRPLLFEPTDEDRTNAAHWAVNQMGKAYLPIGIPNNPLALDCVQLTEWAYRWGVGKGIVPGMEEEVILTPNQQYRFTKPVDEVEVSAGDTYSMKVRAVFKSPYAKLNSPFDLLKSFLGARIGNVYLYEDLPIHRTLKMSIPDNVTNTESAGDKNLSFDPDSGDFSITPAIEDAGKVLVFRFQAGTENLVNGRDPDFVQEHQTEPESFTIKVVAPKVTVELH